jgi:YebC/PmpR family DNA-binding regulatory protein
MSGHNKWSSIKHKKGAADAKRGKLFSRVTKEIMLSAREGGGDINLNARLRQAVTSARAVNMPNDNIERAIKKATGELGGAVLEEIQYEGYAPGGVAVIVHVITDNRNRTAADVRTIFNRANASMAGSGSVSWMFHRKSRFVVEGENANEEKLLEILLDAGANVEDVQVSDTTAEIIAAPDAFGEVVVSALEKSGIAISESSVVMVPENTVPVATREEARKVLRFIETLEDYDDVQVVYSNLEVPDAVMEQLAAEE